MSVRFLLSLVATLGLATATNANFCITYDQARNYLQEACADGVNNGACTELLQGCECVACASHGDCGQDGYCLSGACSTDECASHGDCGQDEYCYKNNLEISCDNCGLCSILNDGIDGCCPGCGDIVGVCNGCTSNDHCAAGYSCDADTGKCVECTSHNDCGSDGYCYAPGFCDSCSDCQGIAEAGQGDPIDGVCPDCSGGTDDSGSCTSHENCGVDEYCYEDGFCDSCYACSEDLDSITGCCPSKCGQHIDFKYICGNCEQDVGCAAGYSCDAGECVSGGQRRLSERATPKPKRKHKRKHKHKSKHKRWPF